MLSLNVSLAEVSRWVDAPPERNVRRQPMSPAFAAPSCRSSCALTAHVVVNARIERGVAS
jgi:hypothetical protein